jgi:hypothetical protein
MQGHLAQTYNAPQPSNTMSNQNYRQAFNPNAQMTQQNMPPSRPSLGGQQQRPSIGSLQQQQLPYAG